MDINYFKNQIIYQVSIVLLIYIRQLKYNVQLIKLQLQKFY